jgi:hypothetical protein
MPANTQCVNVPPGAFRSIIKRASSLVVEGADVHRSGGEISAPWHV